MAKDKQKSILEFQPIAQFLNATGDDIARYFGKDKAAIVYLQPDGVWYAEGLYQWFKQQKKDITITSMEDDGEGLDEEKVQGRKVLLVDNDIVSGRGYKRSMEALRLRKGRLDMKAIKFAAYFDRPGLADFAVKAYQTDSVWRLEALDAIGLKIVESLAQNGRAAFADIGKKVRLSPVAVKSRVDRLINAQILQIRGQLRTEHFYSLSAHILIDADSKTIAALIERLDKLQEVYHIVKLSAGHNLSVSVLGRGLEDIEKFIEKEIRSHPGVKHARVRIGDLPIAPNSIPPKLS